MTSVYLLLLPLPSGFLQVDLAVVEVGIGGAYDCTNIIRKPVVCGVSSLGIDHTSLLGDTVEKIAWQKGGIFKVIRQAGGREVHGGLALAPGSEEWGWDRPLCPDSGQGPGHEQGLGSCPAFTVWSRLCPSLASVSPLKHKGREAEWRFRPRSVGAREGRVEDPGRPSHSSWPMQHGVPAFTVLQPEGPLAVLRDRAQQISCPLYLCPPLEALEERGRPLTLGLEGEHQRSNAALALQLAHCWLQWRDHQDVRKLKVSRPSVPWPLPLAPVFQPTSHMRHGLRDTEWPGRTQVLRRGPLTWYLDGAHTTSSVQACVRWFRQALQRSERPSRGPEVRVLLFNSTGDRDPAALLKLLQPCQFDYAVFCPNLTEVASTDNADQQNFTVTLDQVLLRCLEHQQHWSCLDEEQAGRDLWRPSSLEPGGPAPLRLAPRGLQPCSSSSLVFSCISHALQWISQGRDPVFQPPSLPRGLLAHPTASNGASVLREATAIHVLVTGSLHLVGGVLKLLEPSLSQ
ncbi:Hypothetical predicted protein [Marmota monax]|uniref:tetrahydrofolate synthase n=1 Tax=Marmota monax TaxID=9995 RepID=A0A5E4AM70_MARMO|nr:Hypothetical predicted protein [Marmota monax]